MFADAATEFIIYSGLEDLPQFNPDKEQGNDAVRQLRKLIKDSHGVIISTPEYAFGVPGALKNALDWTVSSGELNEKPLIAISASPLYEGGSKAMSSLLLTLSALGTKTDNASALSIANVANKIVNGEIKDEVTINKLREIYRHLLDTIKSEPGPVQ